MRNVFAALKRLHAAVVVVASTLLLCWQVSPSAAQPARPPGIAVAVLPFANASDDPSQDFLADGLTDEIAAALARVQGLDVLARSSVFGFRGQNSRIQTIGQTLNARYLVEGSARRVETRLRLSVNLIRVDGNARLWSREYSTELARIFDVQGEIVEGIATALHVPARVNPGDLVRNRAKNLEAYEDFLRAKILVRARGAKPLADAAVVLETVVAREPDYAPAAALLAYDYALTPLFEQSLRSAEPEQERRVVERTIPRADALARRATTLDPGGADGFVALGYANLVQRKMLAAEDAFKQALALNPNHADGLHGYSQFLAAMGRIKESLAMRERLQSVEPFVANYTADTAEIYWLDGDTDKAIAMLQPFRPGRTLELALIEAAAGRYREAAALVREMPATNYRSGMTETAAQVLESAPARVASPERLSNLGSLGFVYMHVGAPERVLEFYEAEIQAGYFQPISTSWFWHPSYTTVRRTERFKRLMRGLGLVDYWRARGWPALCQPAGADDFACDRR